MNEPAALGLPSSTALAEADPQESLSELMSRDPEGFSDGDLDRLVGVLRAQRVKFEEAEAAGKTRGVKQPRIGAGGQKSLSSPKSAEDLGL